MEKKAQDSKNQHILEAYQDITSLRERYAEFTKKIAEKGYPHVLQRYYEAILMTAQTRDEKQNKDILKGLEQCLQSLYEDDIEDEASSPETEQALDEFTAKSSYAAYLLVKNSADCHRAYQEGNATPSLDLANGQFYNESYRALEVLDPALLNKEAFFYTQGYHRSPLDKYKLRIQACRAVGIDRNHPVMQLMSLSWLATHTRMRMMAPLRNELHAMRVAKTFTKFKSKFDTEHSEEELYWRKLLIQQTSTEKGSEFFRGYYDRIELNRSKVLEGIEPHFRPEMEVLAETLAYMKPLRQLGRPISELLREALAPAAEGDYDAALDGLAALIARSEQSLPRFAHETLKQKVSEQRSLKWRQENEDKTRRAEDAAQAEKAANHLAMIEIWNKSLEIAKGSEEVKALEKLIGKELKDGPVKINYQYEYHQKARFETIDFGGRRITRELSAFEIQTHTRTIWVGEINHGAVGLKVKWHIGEGSSRSLSGIIKELTSARILKIEAEQMSIEDYASKYATSDSSGLKKYRREARKRATTEVENEKATSN